MQARSKVAVIVLLVAAVSTCVRAESNEKPGKWVNDDDILVMEFNELEYPLLARSSGAEGVVAVKVKLDNTGRVLEAVALSGRDELVPDSLANVKTWRFQPNGDNAAVVVYSFRRASGRCKSASSFFTLERPNLATITACWPAAKQANRVVAPPKTVNVMVSDKDIEVLDFEDLGYPPVGTVARVRGVVVVEANLNDKGEVVDATAISGHGVVIPYCLANVKKWRFRPNAQRKVVVVYNFEFPCSGIVYKSDDQTQFVLEVPNFATITGTPRVLR
jgi:TonB family protein